MKTIAITLGSVLCVGWMLILSAALQAATPEQRVTTYHVAQEIPLPGAEGWDYLTADSLNHRLFVTHGSRVQVLDTRTYKVLGEIDDTPGVHGVALAPEFGHGYISVGRTGMIVVFDLKSLARLQEIATSGENPDAILYDAFSKQVFAFNGRSRNITVIDAKTNQVTKTIPVDAKPEFAATDLAGHVFVNLEDKNSIAMIDAKKATLKKIWPLTGCEDPSGLAIDRKQQRLFSVCRNKVMAIVDAKSGRAIATLPIGGRVDGAAFDATAKLAFASGGDGTLTVIHEDTAEKFSVVQTVTTKLGARTMTVDEATHRIYTVTAKFHFDTAKPQQRPLLEPSSFEVIELQN